MVEVVVARPEVEEEEMDKDVEMLEELRHQICRIYDAIIEYGGDMKVDYVKGLFSYIAKNMDDVNMLMDKLIDLKSEIEKRIVKSEVNEEMAEEETIDLSDILA